MNSRLSRMSLPVSVGIGCLFAAYLVILRPGYLLSTEYLGILIFLQVLAAVLWKFRQRFFPFLIAIFLGASMDLPFQSVWVSGRWFILGAGALAGGFICL